MNGYQSYETQLKSIYAAGLFVPEEIDQLVPSSNKSRWKNQAPIRRIGYEWCQTVNKTTKQLNLALENQQKQRSIRVLLKVNLFLVKEFIQSGFYYKSMRQNMEKVVNFVSYLKQYTSTQKAAKLIGLKRATFQSYLQQVKYKCFDSPILFCFKANPLQLSFKELSKIRELMNDEQFKHWPASSIYYYGVRNQSFLFSKSTFYKYTRMLGLTKRWVRKKIRKEGLRASRPNQYWHADVTVWDNGGIRYYIYLVVDNYSRKILSWNVNQQLSARLMFENLQRAHYKFHPKNTVQLIVDGGPENQVKQAIDFHQLSICKLNALVDIEYSNSMVEATNQIIKKYYFRTLLKIKGIVDPNRELPWIVKEINSVRPSAQLNGLTPDEVFFSRLDKVPPFDQTAARMKRRSENLNYSCIKCSR